MNNLAQTLIDAASAGPNLGLLRCEELAMDRRLPAACLTCCAAFLLAACGARDTAGATEPVYNVPVMVVSHLYVATTGLDTNAGTDTKPFATIARAAQAATPGTIVHVAPQRLVDWYVMRPPLVMLPLVRVLKPPS
jgi:hypothetical protein